MTNSPGIHPDFTPLTWQRGLCMALGAIVCFHLAYTPAQSGVWSLAILGYVIGITQLARMRTLRQAVYTTVVVGFACYAPQLECFWRIFGPAAIPLWLVLAVWLAAFVALTRLTLIKLGPKRAALLVPFLWTGLEYFRSELYYLKFSWLNVGYAFSELTFVSWQYVGVYGVGFLASALVAASFVIRREHLRRITLIELLVLIAIIGVLAGLLFSTVSHMRNIAKPNLILTGVQLEFPDSSKVIEALDKSVRVPKEEQRLWLNDSTDINIVVLPEYTLDGEPSDALKDWCRTNQKFLIVGGKDDSPGTNYFNTAYVIGTNGTIVFQQVKRKPIQFFKDGLPAIEQKVWDSPWGKIGICICYDLSYTRITDELIRQGAQMLIVPTMDVESWGAHQHNLHARIAPVRAAEYGVPIFRVASSGISQGVDRSGQVRTTAPFPGEGEVIFFGAHIGKPGTLPLDRWLAPLCVAVTAMFLLWLLMKAIQKPRIRVG